MSDHGCAPGKDLVVVRERDDRDVGGSSTDRASIAGPGVTRASMPARATAGVRLHHLRLPVHHRGAEAHQYPGPSYGRVIVPIPCHAQRAGVTTWAGGLPSRRATDSSGGTLPPPPQVAQHVPRGTAPLLRPAPSGLATLSGSEQPGRLSFTTSARQRPTGPVRRNLGKTAAEPYVTTSERTTKPHSRPVAERQVKRQVQAMSA